MLGRLSSPAEPSIGENRHQVAFATPWRVRDVIENNAARCRD
jgi:hypothetical protein